MHDERDEPQDADAESEEEQKPEPNRVTVGPIEIGLTVTIQSPDPGGPPDPGSKAGLRPKKKTRR